MGSLKGFNYLQNASDLLKKLEHDYERLINSQENTYAAFDFFITAYHLLDWQYPDTNDRDNKQKRSDIEKGCLLLQICSHIANGVKHFETTRAKHQSVSDVESQGEVFKGKVFEYGVFDNGELIIKLEGKASNEFGPEIRCSELAEKVLKYWKEQLNISGQDSPPLNPETPLSQEITL